MGVIFFDGDQTLWDFQAPMRRTLAATIKELRRQEPTVEGGPISRGLVTDREAANQLRGAVTNLEFIRLAAFTRSLWRLGIQDARLALPAGIRPDAIVADLHELPALIDAS